VLQLRVVAVLADPKVHPEVEGVAGARSFVSLAEVVGHGGDPKEPDDAVELR
jgi:hypothetical protein